MSDTVTPEELVQLLNSENPPRVFDVRRRIDFENDPAMIPGAAWKDPENVAEWGKDLDTTEIVIYCARGGSVSRSVQEKLRGYGLDVKFVEGGIEAWRRTGKRARNP